MSGKPGFSPGAAAGVVQPCCSGAVGGLSQALHTPQKKALQEKNL